MSKDEWFIIDDYEKFIRHLRTIVFDGFGKDESVDLVSKYEDLTPENKKELDEVLTQNESMLISKDFLYSQKHKKTGKKRILITSDNFAKLVESLNARMVSNILNNLVNQNLLESAYDESCNDFIFWLKDDNKNKEEKPETD